MNLKYTRPNEEVLGGNGPNEEVDAPERRGAMQAELHRLISPERTIHRIASRADLDELVEARGVGWQLAGNLRQLLGYDQVGADRTRRRTASGWYLLHEAKWLLNTESRLLVPLFGTVRERLTAMQEHEPGIDEGQLKNLCNGKRKKAVGNWRKLDVAPSVVMELDDGSSITGLTLPPDMLDFSELLDGAAAEPEVHARV